MSGAYSIEDRRKNEAKFTHERLTEVLAEEMQGEFAYGKYPRPRPSANEFSKLPRSPHSRPALP